MSRVRVPIGEPVGEVGYLITDALSTITLNLAAFDQVDEFSKNMFAVAIGGGLTILAGIITKVLEFWFEILQEKRNFRRSRREKHARKSKN